MKISLNDKNLPLDTSVYSIDKSGMSEQEFEIFNGLKTFAPEAAAFFKSGIQIYNGELDVKSYLLAHIAREIEGGLRDILCPKEESTKCDICGKETNSVNHQESILKSLGLDTKNAFAEKWHKTAKIFHKYAHRHGAWKTPREQRVFDSLWHDFVDILAVLVGNFYSITNRIDTIISNEIPSAEMLSSLKNVLSYEPNKNYFFRNLDKIGWLQPLYNEGYFIGAKNPEPIFDNETGNYKTTYWEELNYLRNVGWNMSNTPNCDFSILLKIIDDIFGYRKSNKKRICNSSTDETILMLISWLPNNLIKDIHFTYIRTIFKTPYGKTLSDTFNRFLVGRFIREEDKTNLLECLKIVLLYRKGDVYNKYQSLFDTYFLYHLFAENGKGIIDICGIDGVKIALAKLYKIDDFTWMNIKTIEDHYQNGQSFYEYPNQLIVLIRESLLEVPMGNDLTSIIKDLINKDSRIGIRIAFYVINIRYDESQNILWNIDFNPLEKLNNNHELYELFKAHSLTFTKGQITAILNWITVLPDFWEYDGKQLPSQNKKMWLMSLLEVENENVKEEYERQCEFYPYQIEHPGFTGWMESQIGNKSPLEYEIIKGMKLTDIISYFVEFQNTKYASLSIFEPNIDGLSDVIKYDISHNLNKYISNISLVINAPIGFQYAWLSGIWKYCYDKKTIFSSYEIFSVINKILDNEEFWVQFDEDSHWNRYEWFVNRVLSIMTVGLDCHKKMFENQSFPIIKDVILKIYNKENKQTAIDYIDLPNQFINSIKGNLYQVLIDFMVASAVCENKSKNGRWDNEIKIIINELLTNNEDIPLFYYALGKEMTSLYWIDCDWLEENIQAIIPIENVDSWRGFIIGYHYHNNVNQIFQLLNTNGHYQKILERRNLFDHTLIKLVIQHICIAYHSDTIKFDINDPVMCWILNSKDPEMYENIIQFYESNTKHKELTEKVKELWKTLFEINKDDHSQVSIFFLGESYRWIAYFDNLDDQLKMWLLYSAKNLQLHAQSYFVRELKQSFQTNKNIGEIILEMIVAAPKINYISEIEGITKLLYENGDSSIANKICEECAKKNYLGLKAIYNQYHGKY